MNYGLAILAPIIGARSESFIQRHMQELLPGGTVVVADTCGPPHGGQWSVHCPSLILHRTPDPGLGQHLVRTIARRLGWEPQVRAVKVKRFLREYGVRSAIGEYLDWSASWLDVAQALGIRFFGHAHGYDVSMRLRESRWRSDYLRYNRADGIITISEASKTRLIEVGVEPAKIHVIPCGVDVPSQPLKRVGQDVVRCVAVGRMVAKKAPILNLDAFRRAAEAGAALRLDYVGAGELLAAAHQFVRAFSLGDRVTLHGGQSNVVVQRLLREADIFLQHSMVDPETGDEEGLPVAILEAMANALPVVSTRHAGIPEAVVDGTTGYLVREGDSAGMADAVLSLARDPDLRHRMGEEGWRRAREHFSWEKERTSLLSLLGLQSKLPGRPALAPVT